MNKYAVVLAGGGGTRFWPLSRKEKPKQLLRLGSDDIMLNDTIARFEPVIPLEHTYVVTNQSQAELLSDIVHPGVPKANILVEPAARSTAASILYAALTVQKTDPDAILAVFPADHYITDTVQFRAALELACQAATTSPRLVTIGIRPVFAATGYGYMRYQEDPIQSEGGLVYAVEEFVEKPDLPTATAYLASHHYLWNSGILIGNASVMVENFHRYLPRLYRLMSPIAQHLGTSAERASVDAIYAELPSISIDYGILERSDEVLVVVGDFDWNDVGTWEAFGAIFPPDSSGNIVQADHIGIRTQNSIIYSSDRLIATIGIDGLIIADTKDALLICPKEQSQAVRELVDRLKAEGRHEYL
jgi:mannose-1-phosphate guanylyltransferase